MHKKYLLLILLFISIGANAQSAYQIPHFRSADKYQSTDMKAISVISVEPILDDKNGYVITFRDSQNTNRAVEQYATSFKFYLSYKGKRISEYQSVNSDYDYKFTCKCYVWPNIVPDGDEKYVSVQIGTEPRKKDSRDDD